MATSSSSAIQSIPATTTILGQVVTTTSQVVTTTSQVVTTTSQVVTTTSQVVTTTSQVVTTTSQVVTTPISVPIPTPTTTGEPHSHLKQYRLYQCDLILLYIILLCTDISFSVLIAAINTGLLLLLVILFVVITSIVCAAVAMRRKQHTTRGITAMHISILSRIIQLYKVFQRNSDLIGIHTTLKYYSSSTAISRHTNPQIDKY